MKDLEGLRPVSSAMPILTSALKVDVKDRSNRCTTHTLSYRLAYKIQALPDRHSL